MENAHKNKNLSALNLIEGKHAPMIYSLISIIIVMKVLINPW